MYEIKLPGIPTIYNPAGISEEEFRRIIEGSKKVPADAIQEVGTPEEELLKRLRARKEESLLSRAQAAVCIQKEIDALRKAHGTIIGNFTEDDPSVVELQNALQERIKSLSEKLKNLEKEILESL